LPGPAAGGPGLHLHAVGTGFLASARAGPTATLLRKGLVLAAGGDIVVVALSTAEIYNGTPAGFLPGIFELLWLQYGLSHKQLAIILSSYEATRLSEALFHLDDSIAIFSLLVLPKSNYLLFMCDALIGRYYIDMVSITISQNQLRW
jgi:hypothetical protein